MENEFLEGESLHRREGCAQYSQDLWCWPAFWPLEFVIEKINIRSVPEGVNDICSKKKEKGIEKENIIDKDVGDSEKIEDEIIDDENVTIENTPIPNISILSI